MASDATAITAGRGICRREQTAAKSESIPALAPPLFPILALESILALVLGLACILVQAPLIFVIGIEINLYLEVAVAVAALQ